MRIYGDLLSLDRTTTLVTHGQLWLSLSYMSQELGVGLGLGLR